MKLHNITDHEPSLVPEVEGREWKLVFADEFDGTELDRTKWDFRLSMMGKEHPAWVGEEGVHLDGKGNVIFTLIAGEDGRPVSTQLQTGYNFMDTPVKKTVFLKDHLQWNIGKLKKNLFTQQYGYFECRCRLQRRPGWWSAFWVQSPVIGSSLDVGEAGTEIDIMESFTPGKVVSHNVFCGGYGEDMQRLKCGGNLDLDVEEYHRFGLLWDENGYTFYVDGVEDGRITENVSHRPEFILISTEPRGYRFEDHTPTEEAYAAIGDTFAVDYVRVFELE